MMKPRHKILPVNRIFFGPFVACHGNTMVQYPDILGTTDWQAVPYGTTIRNDGYGCLGGSNDPLLTLTHPLLMK